MDRPRFDKKRVTERNSDSDQNQAIIGLSAENNISATFFRHRCYGLYKFMAFNKDSTARHQVIINISVGIVIGYCAKFMLCVLVRFYQILIKLERSMIRHNLCTKL